MVVPACRCTNAVVSSRAADTTAVVDIELGVNALSVDGRAAVEADQLAAAAEGASVDTVARSLGALAGRAVANVLDADTT